MAFPPKCQLFKGLVLRRVGVLLEERGLPSELQAGGGAVVTNAGHRQAGVGQTQGRICVGAGVP